jgi:hypothetical protein
VWIGPEREATKEMIYDSIQVSSAITVTEAG